MAGTSLSTILLILRKFQTLGFCSCLDGSGEGSDKDPSSLFNRMLSCFLNETRRNQDIRPVPPLLGNGQHVDLFKLYWEVHGNGGWESVTRDRSWGSVAEIIGCYWDAGPAVKLIYFKYFLEFDRCLSNVLCSKDESLAKNEGSSNVGREDGNDDDDVVILDSVSSSKEFSLLKRRRTPLAGMLDWLLTVAKSPCDPSTGKLTSDCEEDKKLAIGMMFSQALEIRKAMYVKKNLREDDSRSLLEGRKRTHPSLSEDSNDVGKKLLRCSPRLSSFRDHSRPSSETTTMCQDSRDQNSEHEGEDANRGKKKLRNSSPVSAALAFLPSSTKRVRVGQSYQATLPIWSATASAPSNEDDSKWLGTRIWPLEKENRLLVERVPIGRGRQTECGCQYPGSIQCVRFHVGEKRQRLKLELGSAFCSWGFDRMGEEVALSWTDDEERKFKALIRLNPSSLGKNFWDQLNVTFPYMGRENIVSYYFNVFLLRCRSYQNRMALGNVDSDDEDRELSFSSNGFGYDAANVQEPKPLRSSPSVPFVDLDDYAGTN